MLNIISDLCGTMPERNKFTYKGLTGYSVQSGLRLYATEEKELKIATNSIFDRFLHC